MARKKYYRFKPWMLNGHPGNITWAVKRVIVRGINHGLYVTSTTGGVHAPTSYHYSGRAVDMGFNPGTDREIALQKLMARRFRPFLYEEFGPANDLWIKNGVLVHGVEGTLLEQQHDTHIHIAPRLNIPYPVRPKQRTSRKGRAFLIRQEGVVPYAYNDPAGHATFGVGHLLHRGPVTEADRRKWGTKQHPKSMAFVNRVLAADLRKYEDCVRDAVGRRVRQHRFDACVSLAFNVGIGGFADSTVARKFRAKEIREAGDAFMMWVKPPALKPRRERERALFLYGRY